MVNRPERKLMTHEVELLSYTDSSTLIAFVTTPIYFSSSILMSRMAGFPITVQRLAMIPPLSRRNFHGLYHVVNSILLVSVQGQR